MSNETTHPLVTTPAGSMSRLGVGLRVKGDISGTEDLHIDGNVDGPIHLEKRKLTVGTSAKLNSDVVASEVVVHGSIKGNLIASDRVEIKKDGSVIGDLTTARIIIEDGAHFKGSIEIDRKNQGTQPATAPDLDKPAYARAATVNAPGNGAKK